MSRPVVVCVRHPDHPNEFTTFPGDGVPVVLDIDLGSSFVGVADTAEEYAEWREGMILTYADAGLGIEHPAFDAFMGAVDSADPAAYA